MSIIEAHDAVVWTLDKSPKAYVTCREVLTDLRRAIVNAELRYQEELREKING